MRRTILEAFGEASQFDGAYIIDTATLERLEVVAEPVDRQDRHNSWGEDQEQAYIEAITERAKLYLVDGRQEVGIQLDPGRDQVQEFFVPERREDNMAPAKKPPYCTYDDGDCSICSLVNYGRDCQNNPVK